MGIIREPLNLKLNHTAYPFQLDAFNIIKDEDYFAIFHEQGLGKTKIAIDLAFYWLKERQADSILIVTKKSLIANWKDELNDHGNISPLILSNNKIENSKKLGQAGAIYLCNYELIRGDVNNFIRFFMVRDCAIILDESTQIKTPSSKTAKAFHKLSSYAKKE